MLDDFYAEYGNEVVPDCGKTNTDSEEKSDYYLTHRICGLIRAGSFGLLTKLGYDFGVFSADVYKEGMTQGNLIDYAQLGLSTFVLSGLIFFIVDGVHDLVKGTSHGILESIVNNIKETKNK